MSQFAYINPRRTILLSDLLAGETIDIVLKSGFYLVPDRDLFYKVVGPMVYKTDLLGRELSRNRRNSRLGRSYGKKGGRGGNRIRGLLLENNSINKYLRANIDTEKGTIESVFPYGAIRILRVEKRFSEDGVSTRSAYFVGVKFDFKEAI